jgi:hypothetical protein
MIPRPPMRLDELAREIGAQVAAAGRPAAEVDRVYAGDRISDLLDQATDRTLLVTNLVGAQLLRLAELMDVPGICLTRGHVPDGRMCQLADRHGTMLMVSPDDMFETCARIQAVLAGGERAGE